MHKRLWPVEDHIFTSQVGQMIGPEQERRLRKRLAEDGKFRTFIRIDDSTKIEIRLDNETNNIMTKGGIIKTPRKALICRLLSDAPKPILEIKLVANKEDNDAIFDMFDLKIPGHAIAESMEEALRNQPLSKIVELPGQMKPMGENVVRGACQVNGSLFLHLGEEY